MTKPVMKSAQHEGRFADHNPDKTNGWEAFALQLIAWRDKARVGAETISAWAQNLTAGADVLDLGCGSGVPVAELLSNAGCRVYGVDASPTLVAEFKRRFPQAEVICEPVEDSAFFNRSFNAVTAIGLLFLLTPELQYRLIHKVAEVLVPGGQFLFSSPSQLCRWEDAWTGRESVSLGAETYTAILVQAGLAVTGHYVDEGESHYFAAVRN